MTTERTLKKWRKEALKGVAIHTLYDPDDSTNLVEASTIVELNQRILRMTQELMDLHLMKGR